MLNFVFSRAGDTFLKRLHVADRVYWFLLNRCIGDFDISCGNWLGDGVSNTSNQVPCIGRADFFLLQELLRLLFFHMLTRALLIKLLGCLVVGLVISVFLSLRCWVILWGAGKA